MIQFYPYTNIDMSYYCICTMKNILGLGVLLENKKFIEKFVGSLYVLIQKFTLSS